MDEHFRQQIVDFAWPELKGSNDYADLIGMPKQHVDDFVKLIEQTVVAGKIEAVESTICHKHGFASNCPQLKDRIAELKALQEGKNNG